MQLYELTLIFKPDVEEKNRDEIIGSLKKAIETKGKVVSVQFWGKKILAYEIKKQKEGIYYLIAFEAEPEVLDKLEKKIKLEENIIRHLIVRAK